MIYEKDEWKWPHSIVALSGYERAKAGDQWCREEMHPRKEKVNIWSFGLGEVKVDLFDREE